MIFLAKRYDLDVKDINYFISKRDNDIIHGILDMIIDGRKRKEFFERVGE